MKAADLVTIWGAPDNSRLTAKQYSFRLPVHVAAKLAALEELYPTKSRTQLVGDLLASAIAEVEKKLPTYAGTPCDTDPATGKELFNAVGPGAQFRDLANKYHEEIEHDIGNESPTKLYTASLVVGADGE